MRARPAASVPTSRITPTAPDGIIDGMNPTVLVVAAVSAAVAVALLGLLMRRRIKCGRCGAPPPIVRMPKDADEAMWGGWTCPKCGTALDRTGAPRKKAA